MLTFKQKSKIVSLLTYCGPPDGDRSSMVELQIVVLAVAGSSPVGHPQFN